jgi:DNA-binding beta-propeller fold protein YncE
MVTVPIALAACGRIGFDAVAPPDAGARTPDAGSGSAGPARHYLYYPGTESSDTIVAVALDPSPVAPRVVGTFATAGDITVLAADPLGRYLVAADSTVGGLDAYAIDAATGALTAVAGSPFALGSDAQPTALAFSRDGSRLYVGDDNTNAISVYGAVDSTPTLLSSTAPGAGGVMSPVSLVFDPSGTHLYCNVDDGAGGTTGFAVAQDGSLTPIAGAPWDLGMVAGPDVSQLVFHPFGTWLFAGDVNIGTVLWATVDPASGGLAPQPNTVQWGGSVNAIAFDPAGTQLFEGACGSGNDMLGTMAIDPNTGVANGPTSMEPPVDCAEGIALDASGALLYAASTTELTTWAVGTDGSLSQIPDSPIAIPAGGPLVSVTTMLP